MRQRICLSIEALNPSFEKLIERLKPIADVDVAGLKFDTLEGYDVFIGKKLDEDLLDSADKLKVVFAYKTGVDDFPLKKLDEKGITVVNSHIDSDLVAQYAFGLAVSLVNRITEFDKKFRNGVWFDHESPYWQSIFDMKVGLLGFGHIGKKLNRILRNNGIETYTLNRGGDYTEISTVSSVKELCQKTDIIILSLPKTDATNNIIDEEELSLMKGKFIVNVGRSNSINEAALYNALKNRIIAGAAIDTWNKKPSKDDNNFYPTNLPFWELNNIVLSPHQATNISVGNERYVMDTCEKVERYLKDNVLSDVVNLNKGY